MSDMRNGRRAWEVFAETRAIVKIPYETTSQEKQHLAADNVSEWN